MQEQLPHGMLEPTSAGQASERVFVGLPAVLDAETQGCTRKEVLVPTGGTKNDQRQR
jgi:hypothetical protein